MVPVTPLLCGLHLLLVCFQVQFKVLVITFKALHGMGPYDLRNRLILMGLPLPQPVLADGHAADPIGQGIWVGRVQEKSLFYYGFGYTMSLWTLWLHNVPLGHCAP